MKNILFYCSGGGFGHLARTAAVVPFLSKNNKVTVCSKEKKWPFERPKNFRYQVLTNVEVKVRFYDKIIKTQVWSGSDSSLHPFQKQMMEFFGLANRLKPEAIVVDSTPEIAIIAKLFGHKVIYIYESLATDELRFDLAWINSDGIIFPYPETFVKAMNFPYPEKIGICGGYTRLENYERDESSADRDILITFGKGEGGEETVEELIKALSTIGRKISILRGGFDNNFLKKFPVEIVECSPDKVSEVINSAKILICGAGYNTVMEAFLLRKKIIVIPLERPYEEQLIKAKIFERMGALKILSLRNLGQIKNMISELENSDSILGVEEKIVDGRGARRAAEYILNLIQEK